MSKAKIKKSQKNTIEQWAMLSPEEKRKRYMESIPSQVSASMAFEGERKLEDAERISEEPEEYGSTRRRTRYIESSLGIKSYSELAPQ